VGTLAGLLVGLWLLTPVALGAGVLACRLLGWLIRTRRDAATPNGPPPGRAPSRPAG
jgi:hypothetical protein